MPVLSKAPPDRLKSRCWKGIFFQALIWKSPHRWTIYLNENMFDQLHMKDKNTVIHRVHEDGAYLSIKVHKKWTRIYLKPLQSYDVEKKKVRNGDCRL